MANATLPEPKSKSPKLGTTLGVWLVIAASIVTLVLFAARPAHTVTLRAGTHDYNLSIATTAAEQAKGLGDRTSLPVDEGMLFEFNDQATRCFWMKDMHFSLDIIWLSSAKKVVHIQPSASPATYPATFCPSQPAQYVIELNAGQAKAADIHTGQTLDF